MHLEGQGVECYGLNVCTPPPPRPQIHSVKPLSPI